MILALASCQKKVAPSHDPAVADEASKEQELLRLQQRERELQHEIAYERLQLEREELRIQREALAEKGRRLTEEEMALEKSKRALDARESRASQLDSAEPSPLPQVSPVVSQGAEANFDYQVFHDRLSPHGRWLHTPDYGYIWRPAIVEQNPQWRPYTIGRWAYTDLGWTWISQEPFGWATYHYGRWVLLRQSGWCWVPGTQWAPAWVCWKTGGDYLGWAPLPPESLHWRANDWNIYYGRAAGISPRAFSFVRISHIGQSMVSVVFSVQDSIRLYQQTDFCGGYRWSSQRVHCDALDYAVVTRRVTKPWPRYQCEFDDRLPSHRDPLSYAVLRGGRLSIHAPRVDSPWNGALEPRQRERSPLRDQVIRTEQFDRRISEKFQAERNQEKQRAQETMRHGLAQKMLERNAIREEVERKREAQQSVEPAVVEKSPVPAREKPEVKEAQVTEKSGQESVQPGNVLPMPNNSETMTTVKEPLESESSVPVSPQQGRVDPAQPEPARPQLDVAKETAKLEELERLRRERIKREKDPVRQEPESKIDSARPEPSRPQMDVAKETRKLEQLERERIRQEQLAAEQAQAEQMRQQQEAAREAAEQARMEQVRQQQETAREAAEQARMEQIRQQQEAAREAAEQARMEQMRQQQEAAREAAEQARMEQMRQQQEAAREAAEQARMEQMRQQQEAAREAAEHARMEQMRQQQEAMRDAQERARAEQMRQQQDAIRQQQE